MSHRLTLGAGNGHVYVTRNATLEYQKLVGAGFEQSRRALTERLLNAKPDSRLAGAWIFPLPHVEGVKWIRAYVVREGYLLIVAKIMTVSDPNPLTELLPAEYTGRPTSKRSSTR